MTELAKIDWNNVDEARTAIHAWANRTFPGRTPDGALCKLIMEEVPELLQHKKLFGLQGIELELADSFILLLDLSVMWGVNLPEAIRRKMKINYERTWGKDPETGFYNHSDPPLYGFAPPPHADDTEGGSHD